MPRDPRQACLKAAMDHLARRAHGREELRRKLARRKWDESIIKSVLDELTRRRLLDDRAFAQQLAESAAARHHHGRDRVRVKLAEAGVEHDDAFAAVERVYPPGTDLGIARELADREAQRLARLEPAVAARRLAGLLHRRGFDHDTVTRVVSDLYPVEEN